MDKNWKPFYAQIDRMVDVIDGITVAVNKIRLAMRRRARTWDIVRLEWEDSTARYQESL